MRTVEDKRNPNNQGATIIQSWDYDPRQIVANRTIYLTADRKTIVEEGSPDAAFLLARKGCPIAPEDRERYDLKQYEIELGEFKRLARPLANKSLHPAENKAKR